MGGCISSPEKDLTFALSDRKHLTAAHEVYDQRYKACRTELDRISRDILHTSEDCKNAWTSSVCAASSATLLITRHKRSKEALKVATENVAAAEQEMSDNEDFIADLQAAIESKKLSSGKRVQAAARTLSKSHQTREKRSDAMLEAKEDSADVRKPIDMTDREALSHITALAMGKDMDDDEKSLLLSLPEVPTTTAPVMMKKAIPKRMMISEQLM